MGGENVVFKTLPSLKDAHVYVCVLFVSLLSPSFLFSYQTLITFVIKSALAVFHVDLEICL